MKTRLFILILQYIYYYRPSLPPKKMMTLNQSSIPLITLTPCCKEPKGFLETLLEADEYDQNNRLKVN